jgi:MYXO-CTERM domain-containing protein
MSDQTAGALMFLGALLLAFLLSRPRRRSR